MLQAAFGESCLSRSKTFEWYSCFKNGRRSFEDDPRPGRSSTSHTEEAVAHVRWIICADRRLTIKEVTEDVGIAFGTCQKILTEDFQMRRVPAKLCPVSWQRSRRTIACQFALTSVSEPRAPSRNDPNFMSSVITGDESWVYGYDPETKQMSFQWKTASSSRPKKARQVKSNVKTMLIAFFDNEGIVHHEYVSRGQTVNKEFYKRVLQRLRDAVLSHRHEKWRSGNWILHHDNPLLTGLSPQMNFWRNITFRPPTPSLLPWPCTMRLLLVPATEENNERSPIRWHWRGSSQRDETNEGYYKRWLPEVLSSVTGTLE